MRLALLLIAVVLMAAFAVAPAHAQPLPDALRSAGVTQAQWNAVRAEARVQAQRAQISEASLLAAAEAASATLAASGRFDALTLQRAIFEALAEQADQISELQRRLAALTGDADASGAAMFEQARAALDAGRLVEADRLLAQAAERDLAAIQQADAEVERRRLRAGETIASRGQVAFVQADYLGAAAHYARAAETVPQSAAFERSHYTDQGAHALYERSRVFGEPEPLAQAMAIWERLLPTQARGSPLWAVVQSNRGVGFLLQGQRGMHGALERAAAAFEAALPAIDRQADPSSWASAQMNLGVTLNSLGDRGAPGALERSIAAFEAALSATTRARNPRSWARIQMNLGNALQSLGARGSLPAAQRAIAAYEAALTVMTREADPAGWAGVQINLGRAHTVLGAFGAPGALERAVVALEAAQTVMTRETDPAGWATAQVNLANALRMMGTFGAPGALERSIAAFEAVLEVQACEANPALWAVIQADLALAYQALGRNAEARSAMRRAESAFLEIGDAESVARARSFMAQLPAR